MKLIMAVSREGYVSRCKDDDMRWTGPWDKAIFRALTSVGGTLACGSRTYDMMPKSLPGRHLIKLSTKVTNPEQIGIQFVHDLDWFQAAQPNGWLVGGQTIALQALDRDLVDQCYIVQSDRFCHPTDDGEACVLGVTHLKDESRTWPPRWRRDLSIRLGDVECFVWNRLR